VDLRTGLDDMQRRKPWPYRDSNFDLSAVQPVASRYTDCATPAKNIYINNTIKGKQKGYSRAVLEIRTRK
jgi:hypothetical protein